MGLTVEKYSLETITEETLKFVQIAWNSKSLVCIVIPHARPYQRLWGYLRSYLFLQVKDFDQNLYKFYGQLTAVDFYKSHLVENQIDYEKVICFLQRTQKLG